MVTWSGFVQMAVALLLAPLMLSVIHRTKAVVAGRHGQPWLQPYHELRKLLCKSVVYSRTTTPLFVAGPIVACAVGLISLTLLPVCGAPAFFSFPGDFLLLAYLLGLARFFTVSAALDTGSSFEGMGASREVFFSALGEPALLLSLTTLAVVTGQTSLSGIWRGLDWNILFSPAGPALLLAALSMLVVFLAENARIPVDDPTTHLELTMIHEVMVLDHSGPDFALVQYGACLKLWTLGMLLVGIVLPLRSGWFVVDVTAGIGGMALLGVVTGLIESSVARLRLLRVPQFLIAASVLAIFALVLVMR